MGREDALQIDVSNIAGKPFLPTGSVLKKGEAAGENPKLKKACQDFETIFLHYMLKTMRSSIPEGGGLEAGPGEKVFRDMLDETWAKRLSERGGIGIARMLYEDMKKQPERSHLKI